MGNKAHVNRRAFIDFPEQRILLEVSEEDKEPATKYLEKEIGDKSKVEAEKDKYKMFIYIGW